MAGKRKETKEEKAVKSILESKGVDYNEWKKDIINAKKLEIMSGEDKVWLEETIHNASVELITESFVKPDKENTKSTIDQHKAS